VLKVWEWNKSVTIEGEEFQWGLRSAHSKNSVAPILGIEECKSQGLRSAFPAIKCPNCQWSTARGYMEARIEIWECQSAQRNTDGDWGVPIPVELSGNGVEASSVE